MTLPRHAGALAGRARARTLLAPGALLFGIGCSAAPSGSHGAVGAEAEVVALEWSSCGPTDGPATSLMIGRDVRSCDDRSRPSRDEVLEVGVWGSGRDAEGWVRLEGNDGSLSRCDAGTCAPIPGGRIRMQPGPDGVVRGVLELEQAGGRRVIAFRTETCVVHETCG